LIAKRVDSQKARSSIEERCQEKRKYDLENRPFFEAFNPLVLGILIEKYFHLAPIFLIPVFCLSFFSSFYAIPFCLKYFSEWIRW
jgi:F0F1-type ATP synthase assembly protein I